MTTASQPTDEFLNLPDTFPQDDPNLEPGVDPATVEYPPIPPITVSCRSCERIVGDSSSFICAIRHVGGITMENMVSVRLGEVRITEAEEGAFDQYCLYKSIHCDKCDSLLGKTYISVAAGLPLSLLNKYTISRTNVLFYTHGTSIPSLPLADSEEIMKQLHPGPDEVALTMHRIMGLLVYLREEQDGIVRELKRVGAQCGVDDIDVGGSNSLTSPMDGEEEVGAGWRDRIGRLEGEMERLKAIVGNNSNGGKDVTVKPKERRLSLAEELIEHSDDGDLRNHHPPKRKRIEKPMESNKRLAKPASVSSALPEPAPKPALAVHLPPRQKKKAKKDIVEISDSAADYAEDESAQEESEKDKDYEEDAEGGEEEGDEEDGDEDSDKLPPIPAYNRRDQARGKVASHVKGRNDKREGEMGKDNERDHGKLGTRTRTSLPLGGNAAKVVIGVGSTLGARRKSGGK